jgi:hypothetical protein
MGRYKQRLATGVEEDEKKAARETSLRERFGKKEEQVVYVENTPEKIYRWMINIVSAVFVAIGIAALVMPDTRAQLIRLMVQFIGEVTGMVGF